MISRRQSLKGLLAACVAVILPTKPKTMREQYAEMQQSIDDCQVFRPYRDAVIAKNRQANLETLYYYWINEVPEQIG